MRLTFSLCILALWLTMLNLWRLPLGDGRDELAHLQVIDFYQGAWRLPTLPDDWANTSIQGHQPPLYYVAMAALVEVGLIPLPHSHTRYTRYPFANFDFYPQNPYNRVALVQDWHNGSEAPIRAWHLLRVVSVCINIAAVWLFYRAARLYFDDPAGVPLSMAFLVLAPGFLQTAPALNNNNALFFFSAWATLLLVRALRLGLDRRGVLVLGLALGLGLLTKLYMLPLVVAGGVLVVARRPRYVALLVAVVLVVAGFWYGRNWMLYGDPSAAAESEAFLQTRRPDAPDAAEIFGILTLWTGKLWLESATVYMTLGWLKGVSYALLGLFLLGGVAQLRGKMAGVALRGGAGLMLSAFLPALVLAVYGAWRNLHGDQSAPIMRAVLPLLCLFLAASALALFPPQRRAMVSAGGVGLLAGLALYFQFGYFFAQYPFSYPPPSAADGVLFENGARLLSANMNARLVKPGETVRVDLCWAVDDARIQEHNYAFTAQLIHPSAPNAASIDAYPLAGRYPTAVWRVGSTFCERVPLHVHQNAAAPRVYDLRVGLYLPDGADIPYQTPDGGSSTFLIVGRLGVAEVAASAAGDVTPSQRLANWGALTGYTVSPDTLRLEWSALGQPDADYRYFLHALDSNGEIVAQADQDPAFPTSFWQKGVRFSDEIALTLPPQATALRFGLYDPLSGQRALWADGKDSQLLD